MCVCVCVDHGKNKWGKEGRERERETWRECALQKQDTRLSDTRPPVRARQDFLRSSSKTTETSCPSNKTATNYVPTPPSDRSLSANGLNKGRVSSKTITKQKREVVKRGKGGQKCRRSTH